MSALYTTEEYQNFIDEELEIGWTIETDYQEAWAQEIRPGTWAYLFDTSNGYSSFTWTNDNLEGETPTLSGQFEPTELLLEIFGEQKSFNITTPNTRANEDTGPVLRQNGDQFQIQTKKSVDNLISLINLDLQVRGDIQYPIGWVKLRKARGSFIKFKEDDWISFNGFKMFFKENPQQSNHVKITDNAVTDFATMLQQLREIEDPRLFNGLVDFSLDSEDKITIQGEPKEEVLDFTLESSERQLTNGQTFNIFALSSPTLLGRWVDIEWARSDTPILSNWQPLQFGEDISSTGQKWIGFRFTRRSNLVSDLKWLQINDVITKWTLKEEANKGKMVWQFTQIGETETFTTANSYKIWELNDFTVQTKGETENRFLEYYFRLTNNNGRSWSDWIELSADALKKFATDPLGYTQLQYRIKRVGSDPTGVINFYGITLNGKFINIDCQYLEQAILGISPCCGQDAVECGTSSGVDQGGFINDRSGVNELSRQFSTACSTDQLWNPYALEQANQLYQFQAQTVAEIVGHEVEYFKTAVDKSGTDVVMHEFSLFNVIKKENIKVLVPDNQFQDSTDLQFGAFEVDFASQFEIHITKESFKKAFGTTSRPEMHDYLYFCQVNRMYQVSHAGPYRDFNNQSVYYRVVLAKYQDHASVRQVDEESKIRTEELTNEKSLDEMFGYEQKKEEEKVIKDTYQPLTRTSLIDCDPNLKNSNEIITTDTGLIVSKYQYDVSEVDGKALTFLHQELKLTSACSRSWIFWIKVTGGSVGQRPLWSSPNWQIVMENSRISFLADNKFDLNIRGFNINYWYAILIRYDATSKKLNMQAFELPGSGLTIKLKANKNHPNAQIGQWSENADVHLWGGPQKMTNFRIFDAYVPKGKEIKYLTEYTVKDTDKAMLYDNGLPVQPNAPRYPGSESAA